MATSANEIRRNPVCCYDIEPMKYQAFTSTGIVKRCAGCHYDEETHEVVVDYEDYNLYEVVQESVGLSGVECMKMLLKQGKAKPEDFYDTGKNGVDTTKIPQTAADAKRLADAGYDNILKLARALGLKEGKEYTADDIEDALTERVKSIWLAQQNPTNEGDNK